MSLVDYIISKSESIKVALERLNQNNGRSLMVINKNNEVVGTLSDGDIRRALIQGANVERKVEEIAQTQFSFLEEGALWIDRIPEYKKKNLDLIPVLNKSRNLIDVIDLNNVKNCLPLTAVIMAGGKGTRLLPLTENIPKPLLEIGGKPIIEYNVDLLKSYGISEVIISVNHFGEQIEDYFEKNDDISFVREDSPLGTVGALGQIDTIASDYLVILNSDLLTNVSYEEMFRKFLSENADMMVACVPYKVEVPYAVLEREGTKVKSLIEKPTYSYLSNAGIYMIKKDVLDLIPKQTQYDATDLIEALIDSGKTVGTYSISEYWLDIGKHEDFKKAQEDIKHVRF